MSEKSRVMLCVDACDGFTDEGLSQCLADGDTLLSRLEGWQLACMASDAKVELLTAQRDELLAAMKLLMLCAGDINDASDEDLASALSHDDKDVSDAARAFIHVRNLIAKCEAQS